MKDKTTIAVIIPALNEEQSIGKVVSAIPEWVDDIIVVDNGSKDKTVEVAESHGARVVREPERGYGAACLAGMAALKKPDIVVFLDGDYSDYPDEMGLLVDPIIDGQADMVIGSRVLGRRERGALTPQARFGNWLSCLLMRLVWREKFTDLGPFRAIGYQSLLALDMRDRNYGWTVEMQIKAACRGLRNEEVAVSYRKRIGKSKVSGTIRGVVGAGTKILYTIFWEALTSVWRSKVSCRHLIIFTRYPEPGKTKTRLIPFLGAAAAAELQRRMTERTIGQAEGLLSMGLASIEVRYEGGSGNLMRDWLGIRYMYKHQNGGDVGNRMEKAFEEAFESGAQSVILIGTDIPGITQDSLERAFDKLGRSDMALGSARDGGYYLIGLNKSSSENIVRKLFSGISWSTDEVLEETLGAGKDVGLKVSLVDSLQDVDRVEDLLVWNDAVDFSSRADNLTSISVIIPTLEESDNLDAAVKSAIKGKNIEVIIADGGSEDGTIEVAKSFGGHVIKSGPPRASQMNVGAMAAGGDYLLFLHADTILPEGFDETVRNVLAKPGVVAGAFELKIDSNKTGIRAVERMVNLRSRVFGMPYGDQAIFVRADIFREIRGFPEIPIMEDFVLVQRLKKQGGLAIGPNSVLTSPRRWERLGIVRTTAINQAIVAGYMLGVAPKRLAEWYKVGD